MLMFESNVILDSGKTGCDNKKILKGFESNVILDSGKTGAGVVY